MKLGPIAAGAGGGFLIGGPIGAVIGGAAGAMVSGAAGQAVPVVGTSADGAVGVTPSGGVVPLDSGSIQSSALVAHLMTPDPTYPYPYPQLQRDAAADFRSTVNFLGRSIEGPGSPAGSTTQLADFVPSTTVGWIAVGIAAVAAYKYRKPLKKLLGFGRR